MTLGCYGKLLALPCWAISVRNATELCIIPCKHHVLRYLLNLIDIINNIRLLWEALSTPMLGHGQTLEDLVNELTGGPQLGSVVISVGVGNTPFYAPNVASPTFNAPVPSVTPWNVNPWPQSSPSPYINCQPSPISPSIPLQSSSFPHVPYTTTSKVYNIPSICQSLSPKPLGKLLFPTIYDFKHGSFFKMLIHMSGFEAKNINISANKNSIELRAVKEEIEKQVQDFSGYILKQVARIFYFPEAIEENKIQISINENVIGILIPWKQNAC
ncbi:uncharacterized protein LOC103524795 [Diaphorina citri]|uniref:Uncharacterized protein LOC103524795 n=1 Tax=Diaphorina citri TaxID=121845 RepID=A0A1S3DU67_DIACI|nr:uncharacterized protein LOC103524795 [Diaphorina citri]